jgi:hypothetical protein
MMAIGTALLAIALLLMANLDVKRHGWSWRDTAIAVPLFGGSILVLVSLFVFLWRHMP